MLSDMTQTTLDMTTSQLDRSRLGTPERDTELHEVAEQFEAIFLNEWIKQARQTKLADDILGSSSMDKYQEMLEESLLNSNFF